MKTPQLRLLLSLPVLAALDATIHVPRPRLARGGGVALIADMEVATAAPPPHLQMPSPEDGTSVVTTPEPAVSTVEDKPFSERAKLWAEAVGTGLLTLAIACIGAQDTPLATLGVVSMLVALIYTFDPISGAVYNPAVSLALRLRGRMSLRTGLIFAAAQVGGATVGATLGRLIYGALAVPAVARPLLWLSWVQAGMAEVAFTFAIVSVVLFVGTTRLQGDSPLKGLIIGMAVFGSAVAAGGASGAVFNPAVAYGLYIAKVITGGGAVHLLKHLLLYSVGPSLGAALAYLLFRQVLPDEP